VLIIVTIIPRGTTFNPLSKTYTYAVKFVCVPEVGPATTDSAVPFVPALHRTVINVHNFTDGKIELEKKAVLARSEDEERGPISKKITDVLESNQALFIDCLDIFELLDNQLPGPPFPAGDGFVVIESRVKLDVAAVYTTEIRDEKQEILFRTVTQPFKVRVVIPNGSGREPLPDPGQPPFPGFRAEVLSVDFEKTFDLFNKVIYKYVGEAESPGCPGWDKCTGTREVLIPAPGIGLPFPDPEGGEDEPKSLEELLQNLDPSFKKILDVDATMAQTEQIKQEVTYRWVSPPSKIVVDFQPYVVANAVEIVEDDDQDGQIDEDTLDAVDNDNDGAIDEDPPLATGQEIEILGTSIAVGVGASTDVEQLIAPKVQISRLALVLFVVIIVIIIIIIVVIIFFLVRKRNGHRY
jgi:hypothetical protein